MLTVVGRFQAFPLLPVQWVLDDSKEADRTPLTLGKSFSQKFWEMLGCAAVKGGQDSSKHRAYYCVKSSTGKFRKFSGNFAALVPATIFDTEDGRDGEGSGA